MPLSLCFWKHTLTFCRVLQALCLMLSCLLSRFSPWMRRVSISRWIKKRVAQSFCSSLLARIPLLTTSNANLSTSPLLYMESKALPASSHYVNVWSQQLPTYLWFTYVPFVNWPTMEVCIVTQHAWWKVLAHLLYRAGTDMGDQWTQIWRPWLHTKGVCYSNCKPRN